MIRSAASHRWLPAATFAAGASLLLLGVLLGHPVLAAGDGSTITVTSSAPTADFGTDVQFTVQVAGVDGPGTGTVDFSIDGVDVAPSVALDSVTGSATFDTTTLSAGTHAVTVTYSGDGDYAPGSGSLSPDQIIDHAITITTLASSPHPSTSGQAVTFTATVGSASGTPTGTVDFTDEGADLGTATLDGSGTASIATPLGLPPYHHINATYEGDLYFDGSTSLVLTQVVLPALTTVQVSSTPSSVTGETYDVSVTVSVLAPGGGTPKGAVTVSDGTGASCGVWMSTIPSGSCSLVSTTAGPKTITASYGGWFPATGDYFGPSSGTVTHLVNRAATTVAVTSNEDPSLYGQSVDFTATVAAIAPGSGTPSGTVTFMDGAAVLGTWPLISPGVAFITSSFHSLGTHSITGVYNSDANYLGATSPSHAQVVWPAMTLTTVARTAGADPSTYGQSLTFTASVVDFNSDTPTGTVHFKDGALIIGSSSVDESGQASFTTSALAGGVHSITAVYDGDTDFEGSASAPISQTVDKAMLTVTAQDATRAYGTSNPTFAASYSGFVNGENANTGDLTGAPSCTTTATPTSTVSGGPYPITCTVGTLASNDYAFSFAPGELTITRAASTTIVTSNHDPSVSGQTVTLTATMGGVGGGSASGAVDFIVDGGTPQPEPVVGGEATYATAALAAGVHTVQADYDGDANLIGSTGTLASGQAVGVSTFRLAGSDRYATGAAIVTGNYGSDDPFVYVATGSNFPDGLAGAAAAAFRHAPLVLLDGQAASISPTVDVELRSVVGPDTHLLVLGGPASVSAHLYAALGGYGASTIARLAGADRYTTAIRVSQDAYPGAPASGSVFIASGLAFPDALSAAGIAGRLGAPLILVPGNLANLDGFPGILTELSRLAPSHVYIAGGTAAVSAGTASQIATLLSVTPVRLAGANRYQTATEMTDFFFGTVSGTPVAPFISPPVPTVYVASGLNFPDALAGAALAGEHGAPLLLVPGTASSVDGVVVDGHQIIREELLGLKPHLVVIFGGTGAVSDGIFTELEGIPRS